MSAVIPPGSCIGILGSGQLGRMLAIDARRMGYRVHTLSPDGDTPTGQLADREVVAAYDDLDAVADFARSVDVVTFEFENVATLTADHAAAWAPVRPAGRVLHICQHRLREKTFLREHGFPVTGFAAVTGIDELHAAVAALGLPAVLKTAGFGYDGKGQAVIRRPEDVPSAWEAIGAVPAVLEAFVSFERELSVVAARGVDGSFAHWGVFENEHRDHILDITTPGPAVSPTCQAEAIRIARDVLEALDVIGVLCVEFFLTAEHRLLVNELAPRPHNSGHVTIDASLTSQFEQQLRAVCGLPLGSTDWIRPASMANLLGDVWADGEPDWAAALADPAVKLHLYGKRQPRPGRKMGHLTATGDDRDAARRAVMRARAALTSRS
jgi:5-(carboxyamino)imidazole ribonucleotide synthase